MVVLQLIKRLLSDIHEFTLRASLLRLRTYQLAPARAIIHSAVNNLGHCIVVIMPRQSGKNELQAQLETFLLRRQQYFCHILCHILHHAYQRAVQIGKEAQLDTSDYTKLFTVNVPDLSKWDNESLGRAARGLARAFQSISEELPGPSTKLSRLMMKMCFRFAGMPQSDEVLDEIMAEALENQESIWDGLRDQYREVAE